jgi:hypothetical protein
MILIRHEKVAWRVQVDVFICYFAVLVMFCISAVGCWCWLEHKHYAVRSEFLGFNYILATFTLRI